MANQSNDQIFAVLTGPMAKFTTEECTRQNKLCRGEREFSLLRATLNLLGTLLSQSLDSPTTLAPGFLTPSFSSEEKICVTLRAYGEPLILLLSQELAMEICAAIVPIEAPRALRQLRDEELAVVAFFIARFFAENDALLFQRLYVVDARRIQSIEEVPTFNRLCLVSQLRVSLKHSEFPCEIYCSAELYERFRAYAAIRPAMNRADCVLGAARVPANLALSFPAQSLLDVISLIPGTVIPLNSSTVKGTLQCGVGNGATNMRFALAVHGLTEHCELQLKVQPKS